MQTAENEVLIIECNSLRRELRETKTSLSQAQTELANQGSRRSLKGCRSLPAAFVQVGLNSSTSSDLLKSKASGQLNYGVGDTRATAHVTGKSHGQLARGASTNLGRGRAMAADMLVTLESNNRQLDVTPRHAPTHILFDVPVASTLTPLLSGCMLA